MYYHGHGVTENDAEAVKWYRKAAEQGNENAKKQLALLKKAGDADVNKKNKSGETSLHIAAAKGEPEEIKVLLDRGADINAKDKSGWWSGRTALMLASEKGHTAIVSMLSPPAEEKSPNKVVTECERLAAHPDDPNKVAEGVAMDILDPKKAIPACEQANSKFPNNPRLMLQLGRSLLKAERYGESLRWHRKAAEQGYLAAQCNLGTMYKSGMVITQDYREALKWFSKVAEQGYAPAQYDVGALYYNYIPKDRRMAQFWWKKAAAQGTKEAIDALDKLNSEAKERSYYTTNTWVYGPIQGRNVYKSVRFIMIPGRWSRYGKGL